MKPIEFKQMNRTLMGKRTIKPLPVYSDNDFCISCWRLNFIERIRALFWGTIWVQLRSGKSQPPIALMCQKKGFED